MGASTVTLCLPKGAEKDPKQLMQEAGDCEITDMKTAGSKTSWKMRCTQNGEEMSGSGEVTHKAGGYQGQTKLSGKSGGEAINMTAQFSGKRTGTACDTSGGVAMQGMESVNDMMGMYKSQMAGAMAEQCEIANYQPAELISSRFFGPTATCAGKEKFACKVISKEAVRNTEVYSKLVKHDDTSDTVISNICAIDMNAATKAICKKVDESNYQDMADYCPAEAKVIEAQLKESTSPSPTSTITDNPVSTTIDKAMKLKGLFGR